MKYSKVDWSAWNDIPNENVYNDWLIVRNKKKLATTQTAIKMAGKHANALITLGYTATEVLELAAGEYCYAGLNWVVEKEREKGFKAKQIVGNVTNLDRSTRGISMHEMLNDDEWAN